MAVTYARAAEFYFDTGRPEIAVSYAERAVEIRRACYGHDSGYVAEALNVLGLAYLSVGKAVPARECGESAVRIHLQTSGPRHLSTARSYNILGVSYLMAGEESRAAEALRKALEIYRALHPDNSEASEVLYHLGCALENSDPQSAEQAYEEAIGIKAQRKELGTARAIAMVGTLLEFIGRSGEMDRALERGEAAIAAIQAESDSCTPPEFGAVEALLTRYRAGLPPVEVTVKEYYQPYSFRVPATRRIGFGVGSDSVAADVPNPKEGPDVTIADSTSRRSNVFRFLHKLFSGLRRSHS